MWDLLDIFTFFDPSDGKHWRILLTILVMIAASIGIYAIMSGHGWHQGLSIAAAAVGAAVVGVVVNLIPAALGYVWYRLTSGGKGSA